MLFMTEECDDSHVVISLHTAQDPSEDEWQMFARELIRLIALHAGDITRVRNIAISDGGAPSTQQRHVLTNEVFRGRTYKVALLTNSLSNPIKRGVAKALTWMNPDFKVMKPHDLTGALIYLGVPEVLDRVWRDYCAMQTRMTPIATLALVAKALNRPVPPSARAAAAPAAPGH